jgi:hypothetical protein
MVPLRPELAKAPSPIVCNRLPLSKTTPVKLEQSKKASCPILVTEAGMVMEVIAVFSNAFAPMISHPSPSSTTVGEFAACHVALVKVVLPEVYDIKTIDYVI